MLSTHQRRPGDDHGFGPNDVWALQARRSQPVGPSETNGITVAIAIILAIGVLALGTTALFSYWFGPCYHGVC